MSSGPSLVALDVARYTSPVGAHLLDSLFVAVSTNRIYMGANRGGGGV